MKMVYQSPLTETLFQFTAVINKKYLFASSLIVSGSVGKLFRGWSRQKPVCERGFMSADSGRQWAGRKKRLNTNTKQVRENACCLTRNLSNTGA